MTTKRFSPLVQHAGSGLTMPENLARKIDALSRTLPKDFHYRRLARKTESLSLDAGERTDVSVINTDAVDREGECVLPAGGDWTTYNRVVTFAHRYDQLPVGSNWWIRPVGAPRSAGTHGSLGGSLIAKTHYPNKPADWGESPWLPSAVLHLMQQPVPTCTGKSIGFLPTNVRAATSDEIAARPDLRGVPIIDKWVGIEYAVVPVPCNPEAEMQAVAKGMELGLIDARLKELLCEAGFAGKEMVAGAACPSRRIDRERLRAEILKQIRQTFQELRGRVA